MKCKTGHHLCLCKYNMLLPPVCLDLVYRAQHLVLKMTRNVLHDIYNRFKISVKTAFVAYVRSLEHHFSIYSSTHNVDKYHD